MGSPLDGTQRAKLMQQLILGSQRQPLAVPDGVGAAPGDDGVIATLALMAQRARLASACRPAEGLKRGDPVTADGLLPDSLRMSVVTLLEKRKGQGEWAELVRTTLRHLRAAGLRPHPFDLDRVAPTLAAHADLIDPADARRLGIPERSAPAGTETDAWHELPPAERVAWLTDLRMNDPDLARTRLADCLPHEPAAARGKLIPVMGCRLTQADRPFLESLGSDKSKVVRETVDRLLARLPGTDAYARRLARAVEGFAIEKKPGFFRSTTALVYREGGAGPPADPRPAIAGLMLPDLLAAIGIDRDGLLASPPEMSPPVLMALAHTALAAGDAQATLTLATRDKTSDWHDLLFPLLNDGEFTADATIPVDPETLTAVLPAVTPVYKSHGDRFPVVVEAVRRSFPGGQLPPVIASTLCERTMIELAHRTGMLIQTILPSLPPHLAGKVLVENRDLIAELGTPALPFLSFLDQVHRYTPEGAAS